MKKKIIVISILIIFTNLLISSALLTVSGNENFKLGDLEKQLLINKQKVRFSLGDNIDWWPQLQHDSQHSGISTSSAPETDAILWSFKGIRGKFTAPTVSDNKVFIGAGGSNFNGWRGGLYCIDAETGSLLWSHMYPKKRHIDAAPLVYNNQVIICSGFLDIPVGDIYCYNITDGSLIWEIKDIGSVYMCPVIESGSMYLSVSYDTPGVSRRHYCINITNGNISWMREIGGVHYSGPTVSNGRLYIIRNERKNCVYCLNASTGEIIWTWNCSFDHGAYSRSTVVNGRLYFGTTGHGTITPDGEKWTHGAVFCLDAVNGTTIWQTEQTDSYSWSCPVVYDGKVYIGTDNHYSGERRETFYCLNADSGGEVWNHSVETHKGFMVMPSWFSPAVCDRKVYTVLPHRFSVRLYCFDASSGEIIWDFEKYGLWANSRELAIADGKLFMTYSAWALYPIIGTIYCFSDISLKAPNAPIINGPTEVNPGETYKYTISTNDPNGDEIFCYITWGDGTVEKWIGPYDSGEKITINHTWSDKIRTNIRVRVKDIGGLHGPVGSMKVTFSR
ncbi:MAG: PQQ-binding-like beta-propeller repeat protein [Thermoplasmatales archaeon]|nr:MAG: PQQ-binding-like beta-propeller repeat protein [Thermoplasmatales archaeon]